ncbi:ABC transporter ATP-binding protein [Fundicoccus culcitae]|uniref:ATP-binding cassette domain-containing protein n=1 Tax=Fundicoccus culcitae TaxID=2969821 RepID=A0ABY5P6Z5_9LACT|nr:ATP-binding cassette domain-containing protein [Fundicoccus culcitae]UUX34444.1 ATP-binding cassette domain-containing protein [Fundicoccus culcitae]
MNQSAQVELIHVSKQFLRQTGEQVAGLNNLTLSIHPGEVIGIIGTNGAGKSTLFNCLTGQIPIDSGDILIDGQSIYSMSAQSLARQIGRVFQDPRMGSAPRMSVFENLMLANKRGEKRGLGRSLTTNNRKYLIEKLKPFRLDLEHRLDVPIENLSGGQRQAVSLVMATLLQPKLLLLDEHTASLDPRTAKEVMKMTQHLIQENNLTTIMITHHLQDAIEFCDRIVVMHQGRIVNIYTSEQIETLSTTDLYQYLVDLVEREVLENYTV